jgi:hypothetical protein
MKALKFAVAAAAALLASAANAEWHEARTNHFIIYSEGKQAEVAAFAERLERFDNALRVLQKRPVNEVLPDIAKVHVFRFGDTSDIGRLAGGQGVAGFYIPRAARPVAFTPIRDYRNPGSRSREDEKTNLKPEVVLFHEYTHHYMLANFPTTYPSWYIEGFAEANATIELRPDGSFMVGLPANHRARELFDMQQLHVRKLLDPNFEYTSLEQLIQKYSLGWLLTHYMTFSKARAGQLQTYLKLLADGKPALAAAEEAFGDLNKLQSELQKYKSSNLPAAEVVPAGYTKPTVTTRQLSPTEERFIQQKIKLARGVTRAEARGLASMFNRAAAELPTDYNVQLLAAEASLDALDFAGAMTAANRALAINPNSVDAMLFKARSLFEAKSGAPERFREARALLVRARKTDENDPRPLIEYYRSYRAAPERPIPDLAAAALDQAYDLARHDDTYRLLLTRQLLEENRLDAAEQVLAPVAYGFDGRDPEDDFAAKIMTKIKAKDGAGALTILNKELKGLDGLDTDD